MTCDLNALHTAARDLLVTMRTTPKDYARIEDARWKLVVVIRDEDGAAGCVSDGWAYLKAADRMLIRHAHDVLMGGAAYAVTHPEEMEQLAEGLLAITGKPTADAQRTPRARKRHRRKGEAKDLLAAALYSLAEKGKWGQTNQQIFTLAEISKGRFYDLVGDEGDEDIKKLMREYQRETLGRGPARPDDY